MKLHYMLYETKQRNILTSSKDMFRKLRKFIVEEGLKFQIYHEYFNLPFTLL